MTVPDAMGLGLYFVEGEGPKFERPVRSAADMAGLRPDILGSVSIGEADGEHGDVRSIPLDQMHHILRPAAIAYDLPALIGGGFRQRGT